MELLDKLGIYPGLLFAQIINFLILLFVLYKFLYNPILKVLDKRQKIISKSIDDAKDIENRIKETENECEKKFDKARKQATIILEKTEKQAIAEKEIILNKTKQETAEIIKKAKDEIFKEKDRTILEIKKEITDLVINALEKIIGKEEGGKISKKEIDKVIKEL